MSVLAKDIAAAIAGLGKNPTPAAIESLIGQKLEAAGVVVYQAASDIGIGCFFRKKQGKNVYMRLAPAAVQSLGGDPKKVYGVAMNGSATMAEPDLQVQPMTRENFLGATANGATSEAE